MNLLKTRIAVAALAIITIVLFCWAALTGIILQRAALNEEYYQKIIETADLENLKEELMERVVPRAKISMPEVRNSVRLALEETVNEDWLRKQMFAFGEEFIQFITQERETLLFEIDLAGRREVFEKAFAEQIKNRYPESLGKLGNDFLAGFFTLIETPEKLILVQYGLDEEMNQELNVARKGLNESRSFLPYLTVCGLVLTVILLGLWWGAAGLLKWTGLGFALAGAGYVLLWRVAWSYWFCPRLEGLSESITWLASVWEQNNQMIFDLIAGVINPAVLTLIGSGVVLVVAGFALERYFIYIKRRFEKSNDA